MTVKRELAPMARRRKEQPGLFAEQTEEPKGGKGKKAAPEKCARPGCGHPRSKHDALHSGGPLECVAEQKGGGGCQCNDFVATGEATEKKPAAKKPGKGKKYPAEQHREWHLKPELTLEAERVGTEHVVLFIVSDGKRFGPLELDGGDGVACVFPGEDTPDEVAEWMETLGDLDVQSIDRFLNEDAHARAALGLTAPASEDGEGGNPDPEPRDVGEEAKVAELPALPPFERLKPGLYAHPTERELWHVEVTEATDLNALLLLHGNKPVQGDVPVHGPFLFNAEGGKLVNGAPSCRCGWEADVVRGRFAHVNPGLLAPVHEALTTEPDEDVEEPAEKSEPGKVEKLVPPPVPSFNLREVNHDDVQLSGELLKAWVRLAKRMGQGGKLADGVEELPVPLTPQKRLEKADLLANTYEAENDLEVEKKSFMDAWKKRLEEVEKRRAKLVGEITARAEVLEVPTLTVLNRQRNGGTVQTIRTDTWRVLREQPADMVHMAQETYELDDTTAPYEDVEEEGTRPGPLDAAPRKMPPPPSTEEQRKEQERAVLELQADELLKNAGSGGLVEGKPGPKLSAAKRAELAAAVKEACSDCRHPYSSHVGPAGACTATVQGGKLCPCKAFVKTGSLPSGGLANTMAVPPHHRSSPTVGDPSAWAKVIIPGSKGAEDVLPPPHVVCAREGCGHLLSEHSAGKAAECMARVEGGAGCKCPGFVHPPEGDKATETSEAGPELPAGEVQDVEQRPALAASATLPLEAWEVNPVLEGAKLAPELAARLDELKPDGLEAVLFEEKRAKGWKFKFTVEPGARPCEACCTTERPRAFLSPERYSKTGSSSFALTLCAGCINRDGVERAFRNRLARHEQWVAQTHPTPHEEVAPEPAVFTEYPRRYFHEEKGGVKWFVIVRERLGERVELGVGTEKKGKAPNVKAIGTWELRREGDAEDMKHPHPGDWADGPPEALPGPVNRALVARLRGEGSPIAEEEASARRSLPPRCHEVVWPWFVIVGRTLEGEEADGVPLFFHHAEKLKTYDGYRYDSEKGTITCMVAILPMPEEVLEQAEGYLLTGAIPLEGPTAEPEQPADVREEEQQREAELEASDEPERWELPAPSPEGWAVVREQGDFHVTGPGGTFGPVEFDPGSGEDLAVCSVEFPRKSAVPIGVGIAYEQGIRESRIPRPPVVRRYGLTEDFQLVVPEATAPRGLRIDCLITGRTYCRAWWADGKLRPGASAEDVTAEECVWFEDAANQEDVKAMTAAILAGKVPDLPDAKAARGPKHYPIVDGAGDSGWEAVHNPDGSVWAHCLLPAEFDMEDANAWVGPLSWVDSPSDGWHLMWNGDPFALPVAVRIALEKSIRAGTIPKPAPLALVKATIDEQRRRDLAEDWPCDEEQSEEAPAPAQKDVDGKADGDDPRPESPTAEEGDLVNLYNALKVRVRGSVTSRGDFWSFEMGKGKAADAEVWILDESVPVAGPYLWSLSKRRVMALKSTSRVLAWGSDSEVEAELLEAISTVIRKAWPRGKAKPVAGTGWTLTGSTEGAELARDDVQTSSDERALQPGPWREDLPGGWLVEQREDGALWFFNVNGKAESGSARRWLGPIWWNGLAVAAKPFWAQFNVQDWKGRPPDDSFVSVLPDLHPVVDALVARHRAGALVTWPNGTFPGGWRFEVEEGVHAFMVRGEERVGPFEMGAYMGLRPDGTDATKDKATAEWHLEHDGLMQVVEDWLKSPAGAESGMGKSYELAGAAPGWSLCCIERPGLPIVFRMVDPKGEASPELKWSPEARVNPDSLDGTLLPATRDVSEGSKVLNWLGEHTCEVDEAEAIIRRGDVAAFPIEKKPRSKGGRKPTAKRDTGPAEKTGGAKRATR
jgi:hypothetical protein